MASVLKAAGPQTDSGEELGVLETRRVPFWRAIGIGAILIPPATFCGNYAYVVVQALLWGQTSLLRGAVFLLFLLALGNLAVRKLTRRAGLAASELLIIYSMIAVSVCVSGFGMMQFLINLLPAGPFYQTPANHYDRFLHYVPALLVPHDPRVIQDFFRGHATPYRADVLRDWAAPIVVWSLFLCGLCWVTLCLCALVRRQWTDGERLTFPLVYLPLEMAQGAAGNTPFFANRLMWAGFGLAGLLESVNYLNYFYPTFPAIQIKPYHLEPFLTTPPFSGAGTLTVAFYPFAVGIAFLLSLEVSFSCWFFYLLTKLENMAAAAMGASAGGAAHGPGAAPPFIGEQGVGAFVALALFLLWRARKPLGDAFRAAWDSQAAAQSDDPGSPLSPRAALWGGGAGMALLSAFACLIGLPLWAALAFWAVYFLFLLTATRIVVEAGAGWVFGPFYLPVHQVIFDAAGVSALPPQGLTAFGYLSWFESELRDSPMPQQLMATKLGEETGTPRRQVLWAMLIAAALSALASFWTYLHIYYEYGAASAKVRPILQAQGPAMLNQVNHWLNNPAPPDQPALGGMAAGAIVVLLLAFLRQAFVWFPLHPIGYALAGTPSMEYMWCPFLVGWLIKSLVMRYGGIQIYRSALPFFLGLILGDYVVPTVWGLWGMSAHTTVYMAFPH